MVEYHQQLSKWSDKLETKSSIFRQTVPEQRTDLQKDSLTKIQQTVEEAKQLLMKHVNKYMKRNERNIPTIRRRTCEVIKYFNRTKFFIIS